MSSKPETKYLKIQISAEETLEAKALAKSKGMLFQCWLGNLVKKELKNSASEKTISEPFADSSLSFDRRGLSDE